MAAVDGYFFFLFWSNVSGIRERSFSDSLKWGGEGSMMSPMTFHLTLARVRVCFFQRRSIRLYYSNSTRSKPERPQVSERAFAYLLEQNDRRSGVGASLSRITLGYPNQCSSERKEEILEQNPIQHRIMKRSMLKVILWSVLLISVFLKNVEPSAVPKRPTTKTTKLPSKTQMSTTVTVEASTRSTTTKSSSSRNTPRPKNSSSKKTTTATASPAEAASDAVLKLHGESLSTSKQKKPTEKTTTTTTLSPMEIMNRLYQMHGMASHGMSASHSSHYTSNSKPTTEKKKEQQASSSMDDIYRLHALAIAQASHGNRKGSETSTSTKKPSVSSNTKQNSHPQQNSMEQIYQQHSSHPSSMHHILAQHSVQSQHSGSKPQKASTQSPSVQESSGSSLSTLMQPLLKQLTPVGAGISVVLAPLLLFNGFLQFFSNMSRFLNNFAQTMLPIRRPMGQQSQNQNNYFQNLGPSHLKRQPRDWMINPGNVQKLNELTDLFMRAMKEAEVQ